MSIPASLSAGTSSRLQSLDWRAVSASVRSRIAASVVVGVRPSAERTGTPAASWPMSPATRTMKNSSRFDEKIEQNFTRSSSGTESSAASSSTRALNSSQESSRLRSRSPSWEILLVAVAMVSKLA